MKITVITGSPHQNGASSLLADEFIRGAGQGDHEIYRFNAASSNIHPCLSCYKCEMGEHPCVYKDDMMQLAPHLIESELIVFVTPLYFFGFSAQIKTVIDRCYGLHHKLLGGKKTILIATSYDNNETTMDSLKLHYQTIASNMNWMNQTMLLATGCGTKELAEKTEYPKKAYELGCMVGSMKHNQV